jgi:Zn-dependent membrane protease YugP
VFLGTGLLPYVLLVMLPGLGLSMWAAWRVKSTYARWNAVDSGISMNAFDFARYLLNSQGLTDVSIEPIAGQLTDHYDPRGKVLRVSSAVTAQSTGWAPGYAESRPHLSVAAVAVIAHEVGHAAQHRTGDPQMALRQLIVPVAGIGSTLAPWLVIAGVIFRITGLSVVGLAFFAAAVLFTFVTLPVEFGASRRALAYVEPLGLTGERADGARSVLRAAGWTYVAAALTALLTFLYYLTLVFGSRR